MLNKKGFTLIELLVVIAVLGILASVVLVAINPGERIAEARDSGVKNSIGQVATALEAYYTNNSGSYTGATLGATGTLVAGGYLKQDPGSVTVAVNAGGTAAIVRSTAVLTAASNKAKAPTSGTPGYWVYATFDGKTYACNYVDPLTGAPFVTAAPAASGATACTAQ